MAENPGGLTNVRSELYVKEDGSIWLFKGALLEGFARLLSDADYLLASPTVAGVTKLYQALGQNTDGAVSQKIVTDALATKIQYSSTSSGQGGYHLIYNANTNTLVPGALFETAAGNLAVGTLFATHPITLGANSNPQFNGLANYNFQDATNTNFSRNRDYWSGNTYISAIEVGGTESNRGRRLITNNKYYDISPGNNNSGTHKFFADITQANANHTVTQGTFTATGTTTPNTQGANSIGCTVNVGGNAIWAAHRVAPVVNTNTSSAISPIRGLEIGTSTAANFGGVQTVRMYVDALTGEINTVGKVVAATAPTQPTDVVRLQELNAMQTQYVEVTATTQQASVNTKYKANNSALVTITLPNTGKLGDQVFVRGYGTGRWRLNANSGAIIRGNNSTAPGGFISAQAQYDTVAVEVIAVSGTTITEWTIIGNRGTLNYDNI